MNIDLTLGALYRGGGRCAFRVWAPNAKKVEVHLLAPSERLIPLERDACDYHCLPAVDVFPGTRYTYRLDGEREFADPASRYQPEGVHGPSEVIDLAFEWTDSCWYGIPLSDYILYELHIGTYTPEGTFDAVIPHLDELVELGVTALELMPVAQFPGTRNWGYDGVYPFAVQNSYGGAPGLKRLVDACHKKRLAVVLDVVYNHLGPEGNYITNFAPYFTGRHETPWGNAVNFDGAYADGVRRFFFENAISWFKDFHFDALRIDAVHAILDFSATPFLEELGIVVDRLEENLNRRLYLIPESDLNDTRLIRPRELGGFALDAQWCDDFHHALVSLFREEKEGYYQDFGELEHLAKSFREGYVYSGQYSSYRRRRHGNSSREIPAERFIVFSQNHDQVGNRMRGERLDELISFDALKLVASTVLFSPYVPLLFMGQEYGEPARFPYFISHEDAELVEAVRKGRREDFAEFKWNGEPPDPADEAVFQRAKLHHDLKNEGLHGKLLEFYTRLIYLRKHLEPLSHPDKETIAVDCHEPERILIVRRWKDQQQVACIFHYKNQEDVLSFVLPKGIWRKVLDSCEQQWNGAGTSLPESIESTGRIVLEIPPYAAALYVRQPKE